MIVLKKLDQKEDEILNDFIEEIQKFKAQRKKRAEETKQSPEVKSKKSSKKHQAQQNREKGYKNKLKPFYADRYVRMCYLMLRKGLYGLQKQKSSSPNIQTLTEQLQFYHNTFEFSFIPSKNIYKIKIFQPIPKSEIPNYLDSQVIKKIQELGNKVHYMFQNYFTSQISQKQNNIKRNQDQNISPLKQIVEFIEKNYCWTRWKVKDAKKIPKKISNNKQQKLSSQMNMHQVLKLSYITSLLNQLQSNKNFSIVKRQRQLLERQIMQKSIGVNISAIEVDFGKNKSLSSSELFGLNLQELSSISLKINDKTGQNIMKERQELGYLKQSIEQFNYGLLSNEKLKNVECKGLGTRIRNGQVIHYFQQKQTNKSFLESLMKVYNKYDPSVSTRHQNVQESQQESQSRINSTIINFLE